MWPIKKRLSQTRTLHDFERCPICKIIMDEKRKKEWILSCYWL